MSYFVLTSIIFVLAITVNSLSVFLQKRYRLYDKFHHGWMIHSLIILPFWLLFTILVSQLDSHYTAPFDLPILTWLGYGLITMSIVMFTFAIREVGSQALVNGNFFGKGKMVNSGIYRFLKNPIYDSYMLFFVGLGFSFSNAAFFFLAVISYIGLNAIESRVEIMREKP